MLRFQVNPAAARTSASPGGRRGVPLHSNPMRPKTPSHRERKVGLKLTSQKLFFFAIILQPMRMPWEHKHCHHNDPHWAGNTWGKWTGHLISVKEERTVGQRRRHMWTIPRSIPCNSPHRNPRNGLLPKRGLKGGSTNGNASPLARVKPTIDGPTHLWLALVFHFTDLSCFNLNNQ